MTQGQIEENRGFVRSSGAASAYGWMSLGCVLFAAMNVFARVASTHVPWPVVACTRGTVGALVAFSVARIRRVPLRGLNSRAMWARSIFGTLALTATFYALGAKALSIGDASTLFAIAPVLIALLAPYVLHEGTGRRVWIAVAISTVGVIFVVRPEFIFGQHATDPGALWPATVAVLAAIASSFAMMMLRKIGRDENRPSEESIVLHFSLTAVVVQSLLAIPRLGAMKFDAASFAFTLAAGMCGGFAQLAMTRAYSRATAARVGAFGNLTVVLSTLFAIVFLSEKASIHSIFGMSLVIFGSVLVSLQSHDGSPPPRVR